MDMTRKKDEHDEHEHNEREHDEREKHRVVDKRAEHAPEHGLPDHRALRIRRDASKAVVGCVAKRTGADPAG